MENDPRSSQRRHALAWTSTRLGGWREHTVTLPEGRWRDAFTRKSLDGGTVELATLLGGLPVALLVREDA
ncbi:hypothetical protein [Demequina litorisediminis]|uniref:Uncharacterized protein n=1 Tax=Demequina litorisediminis TaxID=1849022 RepID=A0ABQ6I869_9MICO|nr:hypothetical protein [Demequina litorisediminis]GMA33896.1 hypothetical protein GCM10025876_01000 [Demequina litorisediminis]